MKWNKIFLLSLVFLVSSFLGWIFCSKSKVVEASQRIITTRLDFDSGTFDGIESSSKEGDIKMLSGGTWNPRVFKTTKVTLSNQTAITTDGTDVYLMAGADRYFTKYLSNEDRWVSLANAPHMGYYGSDLVKFGNYIYAIFGSYTKNFSRYSIINNTWEDIAEMPDLVANGSSLETDGTYIYALRGSGTYDFWKYDPAANRWSSLTVPPATISTGASLVYKNGYLYTPRGGNVNTFYKYNVTLGVWSTTPNIPATINSNHKMSILGDYIYLTRDSSTNSFYRFSTITQNWETITNLPQTSQYVGSIGVGDTATGFVYVFRGNGTYDFWKYNPRTNDFLGLTDLPNTPGTGADFIYMNSDVYFRRGNNSTSLYKYNVSVGGTWTTLTSSPLAFNDDTKGVRAGDYLYYLRGGGTNNFYRFDPNTGVGGTWTDLMNTSLTINYGASLIYPGSGNYIYATRGGLSRTFMRYTIGVGETWSDPAVADLPDNAEAGYGSRMVTDGTDIYYISGSGITKIYKYTIGNNTWTELGNLPFSPYYGTDASYYNGKIYILSGAYKPDFWEYTIATNTWRQLPPIQTYGLTEIGFYNGASIVTDGNGTFYVEAGGNNTRFFSFTAGASNYSTTGTWISSIIDLGYVTSWLPLGITSNTTVDTAIGLETRTSSDGTNWENWKFQIGGSIASTSNRYIQIRATLSSTGNVTPTLSSVVLNYNGDLTVPTNPTEVTGLSQQVAGVGLTDGNAYSYVAPYFSWSGANDTETGIAGYYVYFGTNSNADPEIDGSLRTNANYLVSDPMSHNTYYLRLKAVDVAGNKSDAVTLFTYEYNGVAPPSVFSQTLTSEFGLGTTDLTNIDNDQIKLLGKSGFWQQDRLSRFPNTLYYSSGLAYSSSRNKLYVLRGYGTNSFYQYDLVTNIGSTLANAPSTFYYGDLIEGPEGYLYALRGYSSNSFWRYDIANDVWSDEDVADAPQPVNYGSSLIFDGDRYIYALKGNSDDTFMRYDIMTNSWETLNNIDFGAPVEQVNNSVYNGGDLALDDNGIIYTIQGGSRTGFVSYDVNSESWTILPNLPTVADYGAEIEYDSLTNSIYFVPGLAKTFFYKYSLETQTWSELQETPVTVSAGASLRKIGNYLYLTAGGGSYYMYRYDLVKGIWKSPTMGLFGGWWRNSDSRYFYYGSDIVKGNGDYYYLTRGNYDNLFVRYNPETGEAIKMADAPAGFYTGGALSYDNVNNKIYAIPSQYFRKLFVYDIETDTWSEETNDPPPVDAGDGSAMSFDGTRYIYWIRGAGVNSFYRFDTLGIGTSKWSTLPNAPSTIGAGGDIIFKDNYVYALRGNNNIGFYRFDVGTTTWSDPLVADLPTGATVSTNGFLVNLSDDKLMACRGNNTNICYEYLISSNSWQLVDGTFGPYIYRGGGGSSDRNNKLIAIAGNGTVDSFNNSVYSYISQSETSSFEEGGDYVSPVHDLGMVYKFANINLGVSMQDNTNLTVYTRTSDDNVTWEDWVLATDKKNINDDWVYKVNSVPDRYLMVKLTLTGDGIRTGIVNDYSISYYQDEDDPINPTETNVYQNGLKTLTLTSGVWNNSTAPYFEWNDGNDGENGSGVAGYYTYFGLGETADPEILGAYTTINNFSGSTMVSGETYFFRLKTKDNANNVSSDVGTTFIYKFDNTPPVNPNTISADPPGYTANNSFHFIWSEATDVGSSVDSYCYKTGIGGSETCVSGAGTTGIIDVEAYQTGTNTFYLRTKDVAGNYSSDYVTTSFYYSSVAPSAPKNLAVGQSSNSLNDFSFSWQAPELYYGQQSGLRYYYSINETPSASNVNKVGLSVTYLSNGPYATRKNKNTFYVIVMDEAGNIDYNSYASVDFYAETSAPGIPKNTDISDVSVKETKNWRLALAWETPEASGSGIASYKIYRSKTSGATCSSDMDDFTNISSTTSESFVDTNLSQVKYYYCVTACDSTNECSAPSSTVYLIPDGKWRVAPSLLDGPASSVKTKSATVTWTTSRDASSFVKYGKVSGDYGEEVGSSDQESYHEIDLTGLDPGTTYYYKVLWTDEDGNTGESTEQSLTTNAAPTVSTVKISDVSLYSAYINFTIKNTIKATVQYGDSTAYGNEQEITTSRDEVEHMIKLDDLKEGTIYHLRIKAFDEEDNVFTSDDYIFETLPVPKLLDNKVQQVKGMSTATVRLLWKSNTDLSSIVTYYPTGKTEMVKDQIKLTLSKSHEMLLTDLYDDTDYTFVFKGKDSMGNNAENVVLKFKTSADMRPPSISNLKIESAVDGTGEDATAQIVIYWDTDEAASSQVEYGQGTGNEYPNKSQKDGKLTSNHTVTIPDLNPSEVYHLRVITEDTMGNQTVSYDNVIITPKKTRSALDLVVDNLSKSFGFISGLSSLAQ